jgi:hypothetical protein
MKSGARGLIVTDKVPSIVPTGGSSGGAKHIPHTPSLLREFRRGIAPWIVDLHDRHPGLRNGSSYWAITPPMSNGDYADDTDYLGGVLSRIVGWTLAVPSSAVSGATPDRFWMATLQHLLGRDDLAFISVWHPSFLCILLDRMEAHWDELVSDLSPARARSLRNANPAHVAGIWPRLCVVSCWTDGHAKSASEALAARMPGIYIQPKGLLATEAFVSLPYATRHPLAIRSHFLEFFDVCGRSHLAHELSLHESYSVAVTTGGGLYRYHLQDRVVVDDFVEATPSVRFLGKADSTCDLVGEKLTEAFVAQCMAKVFENHDVRPSFSMLAPDPARSGYVLYVEGLHAPESLAGDLHTALHDNPQYAHAAALDQLAPVKLFRIHGDGYTAYSRRLVQAGRRLGDIKAVALSDRPDWDRWFEANRPAHAKTSA